MAIENSREIEKIFYQDSYGKKKIGSNAHRRVGTAKGGVHGGIIFSRKKYKRYEKNSKAESNNIYESMMSYDKFKTYSKQSQYDMLKAWVNRYSKDKIKKKMKIGDVKLNKLLDEFNIEKESCGMMRANSEELEHYKINNIPVERFKLLPDDQKFEIVDYYNQNKGMTNKDISEMLGYKSANTFNTKKSIWRKEYEERNEARMNKFDYDDDFLLQGQEELSKPNKPKQDYPESHAGVADVTDSAESKNYIYTSEGFKIAIDGIYTGDNLSEKAEAIGVLIDRNKKYKATIIIEEVED